jgi:hypothetical protein
MRIGVLSDTHLHDKKDLPQKILDEFKDVDMILHAGDLVSLTILDKLKTVCRDLRAVWGNMDPPQVRKNLPEKQIIEVGKFRIGMMHGFGHPSRLIEFMSEAFKDDKVNLVIFGHSHTPIKEIKDNIIYFNPGSPTDKIFSPYNSYGIIEINDKIEARIIRI